MQQNALPQQCVCIDCDVEHLSLFNYEAGEDQLVLDYLAEDDIDNVVFLALDHQGEYVAYPAKVSLFGDEEHAFVECLAANGDYTPENAHFTQWYDNPGFHPLRRGIPMVEINKIRQAATELDQRLFLLLDLRHLAATATVKNIMVDAQWGLNIFARPVNILSGTHCTEGTSTDVYDRVMIPIMRHYASIAELRRAIQQFAATGTCVTYPTSTRLRLEAHS